MPNILIATHNRWKFKLFRAIFTHYGFETCCLNDLNPAPRDGVAPRPEENGASVVENALIKARHYHSAEHPWVFGDDSGLEIDALGGEPGVMQRRWAGRFPDDVADQVWLDYLLERMQHVPTEARTARFVDGWALIDPLKREHTHQIHAPFQIATQPVRPLMPGSPVMSVALGLPEDPAQIAAGALAHMQAWGILETLLKELTP